MDTTQAEERSDIGFHRFAVLLSSGLAILMGADLVADRALGAGAAHVTLQLVAFLLALAGALAMARELYLARAQVRALDHALGSARDDAEHWRAEAQDHLLRLGEAIDRQFERWSFTHAERLVALLLLKGL